MSKRVNIVDIVLSTSPNFTACAAHIYVPIWHYKFNLIISSTLLLSHKQSLLVFLSAEIVLLNFFKWFQSPCVIQDLPSPKGKTRKIYH